MPSLSPKRITLRDEARVALLHGVNTLADIVGSTLGPYGRAILLDSGPFQPPRSSRDGVTVAKHIHLSDPQANLACQLLRQVAQRAADTAGDGTTTAIVLARALYRSGCSMIAKGINPYAIKRGIDQAVSSIVGERNDRGSWVGGILSDFVIPVSDPEMIVQVGTLSANSDRQLGALIAEATRQVGKEGTVTVEEGQALETTLDVVEGMQFPQGYLSPYFITDGERMEAVLKGEDQSPLLVYLHEKRLSHHNDLLPILTNIVGPRSASLLVIAEDIADSALALLAVNRYQGRLRCCAVKGPGMADRRRALFDDLAVLTGATVISPDLGIKPDSVTFEMLGTARQVTVTKDDCTIVGGGGQQDKLEARKSDLRAQIERAESDFDRVRLEERLAKLTGGVAVVKVGGQTEAEIKEKKDRAEDAMYATKAAVAEGIVPGGGIVLWRVVGSAEFLQRMNEANGDEVIGWQLVSDACYEPLRQVIRNAGESSERVIRALSGERRWPWVTSLLGKRSPSAGEAKAGPWWGYNVANRKYANLLADGVIDPAKVTRTAIQAAGSIAGLLLTTEAIVADDVQAAVKVRKALQPVMPGQPGMGLGY